ncbi:hypothetical protein [Sphaerisporangium dianthi]|uniref:Resolvase/invertase-type recombinase catalytic domain-containing protein n=1 Tax=Sphaerisporangium dianthi TaxID=1436120 RepID=A0ABV9CUZ6_9ACTN
MQLNLAADTLQEAPDEAAAALHVAKEVRNRAMAELNSLIGVLRDGPGSTTPQRDLASLGTLIADARAAGLHVILDARGDRSSELRRAVAAVAVGEALPSPGATRRVVEQFAASQGPAPVAPAAPGREPSPSWRYATASSSSSWPTRAAWSSRAAEAVMRHRRSRWRRAAGPARSSHGLGGRAVGSARPCATS